MDMDKNYKLQEQTRTISPQVSVDLTITGSDDIFGDLMKELRLRFPAVQFSKAQRGPLEAVIYVFDMDVYFSEPFDRYLDELVGKLPGDVINGLDFFPAEAPASIASEPQVPIAGKGVAEAAAKMNFAQPMMPTTPLLAAPYAENAWNDFGRAA